MDCTDRVAGKSNEGAYVSQVLYPEQMCLPDRSCLPGAVPTDACLPTWGAYSTGDANRNFVLPKPPSN